MLVSSFFWPPLSSFVTLSWPHLNKYVITHRILQLFNNLKSHLGKNVSVSAWKTPQIFLKFTRKRYDITHGYTPPRAAPCHTLSDFANRSPIPSSMTYFIEDGALTSKQNHTDTHSAESTGNELTTYKSIITNYNTVAHIRGRIKWRKVSKKHDESLTIGT